MDIVNISFDLFKLTLYVCLLSAGHMQGAPWVGLNDIDTEDQFVFSDGTTAVSRA